MHPEINLIKHKLQTNPWPQYLKSVAIGGLRGWGGLGSTALTEVRFDFPVCVIAGQNGSGKSTVLKAAAAAYASSSGKKEDAFYAGKFFPDTAWDKISAATLRYVTTQGKAERTYDIRKLTERWRLPEPGRPKRSVVWLDVSRTLPMDATAGYARLAKRRAKEISATYLEPSSKDAYSTILGRPYDTARFAESDLDQRRPVGVVSIGNTQYSQFHQGAGEDATLDLFLLLQELPRFSLVLIDEVETSLHPSAQRRLIHCLLELARTQQLQVILSTHSRHVLDELPPEARILLSRGGGSSGSVDVMYGVTPDYALSRMDDVGVPELYLFVEDAESATLTQEILRARRRDLSRIRCVVVGPADVVRTLGELSSRSRLSIVGLGVLDGDVATGVGCVRLPGAAAPERQVFEDLLVNGLDNLAIRLDSDSAVVHNALLSPKSLADHHEWVDAAARALNRERGYLWTTMCQVWATYCGFVNECESLVLEVDRRLPPIAPLRPPTQTQLF